MAATKTAAQTAVVQLVADTLYKLHLTGNFKALVDVAHYGTTTDVVDIVVASSEAGVNDLVLDMDDVDTVLSGERARLKGYRDDVWVGLRSVGTPKLRVGGVV